MPVRAITSLVNGIKACFGEYSVSILHSTTIKLMKEHPDAWFTKRLHKPLSTYNINIPLACKRLAHYVVDKVNQLHDQGRSLQVKLAFQEDGSTVPIPMYNSDNSWFPINLNGQVHRSDNDTIAPGEEIACRHFASAYARRVFGRRKDFEIINTPEKIQSTFANTPDLPLEEDDFRPDGLAEGAMTDEPYFAEGYYFREEDFSEALKRLVKKYWNMSAGNEKNFYFRVQDDEECCHAMAIRLKKQDGCMKVIFYDPNATLMHRTFLLSEPDLAAQITGEELLTYCFSVGALINIDDRKKSADECDVQCFGASPTNSTHLFIIENGHLNHPEVIRSDWFRFLSDDAIDTLEEMLAS
ncbi:ShET2/EspL2 family type III secretion system effector toxin [Endozoicomonas sp. 8E]|uniref:ShET2/EspL2 family type III secretion system effector toxin n=1 Tax=Endozoicomonas sp. 8E TaxID=3035692 RepID=UPI002938F07A|nr:ShET2/EspL2 family type III secretion system effector toxin [Endozoicomonas sp. 8E]WOG26076.1 ShET2/EspL2 family type III secretion system effector toxin [Endozoicomonas sp. 8E]